MIQTPGQRITAGLAMLHLPGQGACPEESGRVTEGLARLNAGTRPGRLQMLVPCGDVAEGSGDVVEVAAHDADHPVQTDGDLPDLPGPGGSLPALRHRLRRPGRRVEVAAGSAEEVAEGGPSGHRP